MSTNGKNVLDEMNVDQLEKLKTTMEKSDAVKTAQEALLQNLAIDGNLSTRRDQLVKELQAVEHHLALVRQKRDELAKAVQDAGGELPHWEL